uniref:HDC01962 n=1 Tax=Drosophila melanogaster TaxID=7227 RepID=Q6IHQ0_DROME|nr:TPA_inf: HDC01962 [Drosophila melanogaster]
MAKLQASGRIQESNGYLHLLSPAGSTPPDDLLGARVPSTREPVAVSSRPASAQVARARSRSRSRSQAQPQAQARSPCSICSSHCWSSQTPLTLQLATITRPSHHLPPDRPTGSPFARCLRRHLAAHLVAASTSTSTCTSTSAQSTSIHIHIPQSSRRGPFHSSPVPAPSLSRFALISGQWSGKVLGSPALASPDLVNYATGDSNLTSPGLISRPFLSRIALGRHRLAPAPSSRSPTHRSPPALLLSFHFNRGALCWFCSIGKRKLEKCSGFVGPLDPSVVAKATWQLGRGLNNRHCRHRRHRVVVFDLDKVAMLLLFQNMTSVQWEATEECLNSGI